MLVTVLLLAEWVAVAGWTGPTPGTHRSRESSVPELIGPVGRDRMWYG
jgi:hypothetical protein